MGEIYGIAELAAAKLVVMPETPCGNHDTYIHTHTYETYNTRTHILPLIILHNKTSLQQQKGKKKREGATALHM